MKTWISLLSIISVISILHALSPSSAARSANESTLQAQGAASSESSSLDYTFFKTRVEPIFLKKRPGIKYSRPTAKLTFVNVVRNYACSYASFSPAMSILSIASIACMTRFDFAGSLSCSIRPSTVGMICHVTP